MSKINIGGKERPVKYNFNALEELDDLGFDVLNPKVGDKFSFGKNIKFIKAVAFVGLKYGTDETGRTCEFTIGEVGSWLNNENVPQFLALLNKRSGDSNDDKPGESLGTASNV